MAKREKFSIWGRDPDTKKGCYKFYQDKKNSWPINYVLNKEEMEHMKNMMDKFYYSPLKPELVQDVWKKQRDNIIEIKVTYHEVYGANGKKRLEFWTKKPTYRMSKTLGMVDGKLAEKDKNGNPFLMKTIDDYGKMYPFSVARLICFGGDGYKNESLKPKAAVKQALGECIVSDKINWKKNQGYRPNVDPRMDAHHINGKEFNTIYLKYLNILEMSEDEFVKLVYPEHGNFETNHIFYTSDGFGWKLKTTTEIGRMVSETFWDFHYKNREYELVDPGEHREITSNEVKFNSEIKNKIRNIL